ncbi:DUF846-domain-containing protein [Serendipita vermifera]|nr:DUF846-domain-containing protein [Serendipita vermifera]
MATSVTEPLLATIEPDDLAPAAAPAPTGNISSNSNARAPVVLTPTNRAAASTTPGDLEAGIAGIFRQSSHPVALFFMYLFKIGAIVVYLLGGFFTDDYVLSTVLVVVLLSVDFWNCRNVAGRTLVGLRFWNQVDEDGQSYWVFESRDPSRPANPIDSRMFWTALYVFPVLWVLIFILSILKLNFFFIPTVTLALVFNFTNAIGFTYADRDAKAKWANSMVSNNWANLGGLGGYGGQIVGSVVKQGVSRMFK